MNPVRARASLPVVSHPAHGHSFPTPTACRHFSSSHQRGISPRHNSAVSDTARDLTADIGSPLIYHPVDKVQILGSPDQFYNRILQGIATAQHHIVLAALYLGTGEKGNAIADAVTHRLVHVPDLTVHIVLDGFRGARSDGNGESSLTVLEPVLKAGRDRVTLSLTQSPGLLPALLPDRANEVPSVFHVKSYIFDDDVMLSGANMSEDYFTNRLDRYWVFESCAHLCDFYSDLLGTVTEMSHRVVYASESGVRILPNDTVDALADPDGYLSLYKEKLTALLKIDRNDAAMQGRDSTIAIVPTLQYTPAGIHNDTHATTHLLRTLTASSRVRLCTAYFNIPASLQDLIQASPATYSILAASPLANGFLNSRGASNIIPALYRHLLLQFKSNTTDSRITVAEWARDGWTFHGKGMWVYPTAEVPPSVVSIGSPNFGRRSAERDLESQVWVVIPEGTALAQSAGKEASRIYKDAGDVPHNYDDTGTTRTWAVGIVATILGAFL